MLYPFLSSAALLPHCVKSILIITIFIGKSNLFLIISMSLRYTVICIYCSIDENDSGGGFSEMPLPLP